MNSKLTKNQKRKQILQYAQKIYQKEKRFVSKREIRKVFHLEIYNYFENIFDMYQKINIDVPLYFCPKDYARRKILEFVREKSKEGLYPTKTEITAHFGIRIYTYFKNIKDIYEKANIDFSLYEKRKYGIEHPLYSEEQITNIKKDIINYILDKTKKGFYPGAHQIQRKHNLSFYRYFTDIEDAYEKAGIEYQRVSPITLGKKKEEVFTRIIIQLLEKMNYKIKRVSIFDEKNRNKGEDIKASYNGQDVLIELKAYRKDYSIIKREMMQLNSYLINQNIQKGIFITTSNKVNYKLPNIQVINGYNLFHLLEKYRLDNFIKEIRWIQDERVNLNERINFIELKRKEIIDFVVNFKGIPTKKQIEKNLLLSMKSYFKEQSFEKLIKKIKNTSIDSARVCRGHQQELQCN